MGDSNAKFEKNYDILKQFNTKKNVSLTICPCKYAALAIRQE